MAVSATAKSLLNAAGYSNKWHTKRIHRKLDDRDDVIDEALQLLEEKDTSVFTYISSIAGWDATAQSRASATAITLVITTAGPTIAATTITAILGGESGAITIDSATQMTIVFTGGLAGFGVVPAVDDLLPLYIRVDNVLLPVVNLAPALA
jgi:hypothetical protein